MQNNNPVLFIEINNSNFIFYVIKHLEDKSIKILYEKRIPLQGINNNKISNFDLISEIFKNNIYSIEKKIDFTFKEAIILIDNLEHTLINLTGYKKLNGSQLSKDNVTYLLNSLKLLINENEKDNTILHIFNSKYLLDKKEIENLPIGLFGNFYSHELSFFMINTNDHKNLNNILNNCNLKLKKIISKNFVDGANFINENKESSLIFFENSSLRFIEDFRFGFEIILKDISKITNLEIENIKNILNDYDFNAENLDKVIIEKKYFKNCNFRKINIKLIKDIAEARILELSEIILIKNININNFLKRKIPIFLKISNKYNFKCFELIYENLFSCNNKFNVNLISDNSSEKMLDSANNIVQYGWKKEAIPIVNEKKSIISRLFGLIFR